MNKITIDGNQAAAHIAYAMNDIAVIYPITPSSTMAETCDNLSCKGTKNVFGNPLKVIQMQSEAGVAGAVHGALSSGALTTTFTSSQGLLLMIPNMYKIAGELLPTVFFVASRSVASHALNIFCDYSDIYACLKTGFNIINCASVQEVNDICIASELASLKSSTPFICFFDGFRTSHELSTIEQSTYEEIKSIMDFDDIKRFKERALNSVNPVAQGTNQNPDVFFQNRVASIKQYENVIKIVKQSLLKQEQITKRHYDTVEYFGDKNATNIVVSMGSSVSPLKLASKLNKKQGVIQIRLLKPFDEKTFLSVLPKTVKNITILERNLDVNGTDTLYSYIASCLFKNRIKANLYAGVFGLGGKEFTPNDAIAVFENMVDKKKKYFTVGIFDNVSNTSLEVKDLYDLDEDNFSARIYGIGNDGSVSSAKSIIKILSDKSKTFAQGYFDYDSKKSGSLTVSHIRTSKQPINLPFNSQKVDVVVCNNTTFLTKYDMTFCLKPEGKFIINCNYSSSILNNKMPNRMKKDILEKHLSVYTIDANQIASQNNLGNKINTIMQMAFFNVAKILPYKTVLEKTKLSIETAYSKKGDAVVKSNISAITKVENAIKIVDTKTLKEIDENNIPKKENEYFQNVIKPIQNQEGNFLPVSKFNPDGRMPTGTSKFEKRGIATALPQWISENCIQCGKCSMACPHACLRASIYDENESLPDGIKTAKAIGKNGKFRIQLKPLDCTGCGLCAEVCPVKNKALVMTQDTSYREQETLNDEALRKTKKQEVLDIKNVRDLQFKTPYFEFSGACAGCGETPYIKLASQLFGDRMIIANATGCSSIYGGTFPTCPYAKDEYGFGPSFANSLFEDNAEFGLGIATAKKLERENFINTLKSKLNKFSKPIKEMIKEFLQDTDNHAKNRELVIKLKFYKCTHIVEECDKFVFEHLDLIVKPSVWIIGGDGWAFDIGFGGLDHVIASNEDVNILILDTELYSNTGGQTSKSTPRGATAKFNSSGKTTSKKDILSMMMTYKNVYCAQVSMGANGEQCLKAFKEAESYHGPSIILAYAPCINHGYDMKKSASHEAESVKCGYNTLFRYNPDNGGKIEIDSLEPSSNYREYLLSENRYAILSKVNSDNEDKLLSLNEKDAKTRRNDLK